MPGRQFNNLNYRYGMNSQEKDNGVYLDALGMPIDGALTSAEYWEYDSRLGRRWNVDPVVNAWESSYAAFLDNPIKYSDPFGNTEPERAAAVKRAKEYKDKNNNGAGNTYQRGAVNGQPGEKVDCSGMVKGCMLAAGMADPYKGVEGNGVKRIAQQSSKITDIKELKPGNVLTFNTGSGEYSHIGIVTNVSDDGQISFIHSGGDPESGKSGPMEVTYDPNKTGYWTSAITGMYSWDTPDVPTTETEFNYLSASVVFKTSDYLRYSPKLRRATDPEIKVRAVKQETRAVVKEQQPAVDENNGENPFEVLGLPANATAKEINDAVDKLFGE